MEITEVKISLMPDQDPLKAFASITFDNSFVVHDLRVIKTQGKTFVAMPSKKIRDGNKMGGDTFRDIAHPISQDMRHAIEKAVLSKYEEMVKGLN